MKKSSQLNLQLEILSEILNCFIDRCLDSEVFRVSPLTVDVSEILESAEDFIPWRGK